MSEYPKEVWAIKFEDADVPDEVFVGEGAEIAAKLTYEKRLASWNCYLLGPVARLESENTRLREALEMVRSGVLLMVPEPQKSGFLEIIDAALAEKEQPK